VYQHLAHHNFFFSEDFKKHHVDVYYKKVLPEDPIIYLVNPSKTDDSLAPSGHSIIKILPHVPHLTDNPPSIEEYNLFVEAVIDKLERMGLVDIRSRIVTREVLTPYDLEKMYNSNRGAIYGVACDRKRILGFKCPKHSEIYDNLYFAGGSVNPGSGMPMVISSGLMVSDMIGEKEGIPTDKDVEYC
jgi:diapolycopene oxygenase